MSRINPVATTPKRAESAHLNWMGGQSWDISDPVNRLRLAAASCFFGEPIYYHSDPADKGKRRASTAQARSELSKRELDYLRETLDAHDPREWRSFTPTELMTRSIDDALAADPERTLVVAVQLRNEDYIRTTPQVILVRAANHKAVKGSGLVRRYAPDIIKRADEPAVQLAYQLATFGKPIPNSLKRAWADAYEGFSDYALAKYKGTGHVVKSVDVVNLSRPKSASVDKLVKGQLQLTDETWESAISAKGSTKDTWTEVIPRMGHMALLRNLRNFTDKGVDPDIFVSRLLATQPRSMQLPFRYYSAHKALAKDVPGRVRDAVEECLMASFDDPSMPHFAGRVMSLCDNSGSAWGTTTSSMGTMHIAEIANLTGVITGMLSDDAQVGIFGDGLETVAVRKRSSVFDQIDRLRKISQNIGGATEHGIWLFWDKAIKNNEHWDYVFVYSDMQAGHGGLYGRYIGSEYVWPGSHGYNQFIDVPKLINTYRQKVNPNVQVFLVQVAGYQDTIVPETYDKTYILGGWSDGILRYAARMAGLQTQ